MKKFLSFTGGLILGLLFLVVILFFLTSDIFN